MDPRPPLRGAFGKPFAFQVAAFRLRLAELRATLRWDDVWQAGHDRAFMVAGAAKADLLADLAAAVDRVISEGASLEDFRRDFRRIVADRGWTGWTGQGTKRGEAWRTRVIYRTNAASTYAAGRWAQLREAGYPLLVYRHGGSLEPRIIHLGWDGLILAADHPFWATHAPPNGWGCKCYVLGARSRDGAVRLGGQPGKTLPAGWDRLLPKTGAPAGIDRGWAYAPGASAVDDILALKAKLETLPERLSADLIRAAVGSDRFARWLAAPEGAFPVARLALQDAAALGSAPRVAVLSADTVAKQRDRHPEIGVADYAAIQDIVETATHRIVDGAKLTFLKDDPGADYVLVVKAVVEKGELFVASLYRLSRDAARRDREIGRQLRKGAGDGASPPD